MNNFNEAQITLSIFKFLKIFYAVNNWYYTFSPKLYRIQKVILLKCEEKKKSYCGKSLKSATSWEKKPKRERNK